MQIPACLLVQRALTSSSLGCREYQAPVAALLERCCEGGDDDETAGCPVLAVGAGERTCSGYLSNSRSGEGIWRMGVRPPINGR